MARKPPATKTTKARTPASKPRRPAAAKMKPARATTTRAAVAPKRAPAAVSAAPKLSKEELRVRVESLERANAALRTKSRENTRAAKFAAGRIAELEEQIAAYEKAASKASAPAKAPKASAAADAAPKRRGRRPKVESTVSDLPGIAVEEPLPVDPEAAAALDSLEENLESE